MIDLMLNRNVYVARGASASAIYDLNSGKLYRVTNEVADALDRISSERSSTDDETILIALASIGILKERNNLDEPISWEEPLLKSATLEITQACNFRCVHCYEGDRVAKTLSFVEVLSVLEKFVRFGIDNIHIIGGEPMLHPSFCRILDYCGHSFSSILVTSNVSVLDAERIDALVRNGVTVSASLHSDNREGFKQVTGVDYYKHVSDNINKLRDAGVPVEIRSVKISGVKVVSPDVLYGHRMSGYPALVGNATLSQYSDEMLVEKAITQANFEEALNPSSVLTNMRHNSCFCRTVYVDVNLDVYPCILERRLCHGNLANRELSEILNRGIIDRNKDTIDKCSACEFRYACNTCFSDTGKEDPSSPPWYCTYNPYIGEWVSLDDWIETIRKSASLCWR